MKKNWYNLRSNKCPKCAKLLEFNPDEEMLFCGDLNCGFQISQYRAERLVTQMNAKAGEKPRDNFSDLQNFGRPEPESDDFKPQYLDI